MRCAGERSSSGRYRPVGPRNPCSNTSRPLGPFWIVGWCGIGVRASPADSLSSRLSANPAPKRPCKPIGTWSKARPFSCHPCERRATMEAAPRRPSQHRPNRLILGRFLYTDTRTKKNTGLSFFRGKSTSFWEDIVLPNQRRIYIGPLAENVTPSDLARQFGLFGVIQGISRLRGSGTTTSQVSYGFIDFQENVSIRRAFASKVFVHGRHVKVALSRLAMEVALSDSTVYFFEVSFCRWMISRFPYVGMI